MTWGVRFVEAAEAVAFIEKLAGEVSERMRKLKVRGRTLTLKVLRAVANAPDKFMKVGLAGIIHPTSSTAIHPRVP